MINIINAKDFKPLKGENYFFDNNIWMYLFCPIGNYNETFQTSSSRILSKIKSIKANIYINNLVISEFANAFLKLEYNIWKDIQSDNKTDFKKYFRKTEQFKSTQILIKESINRINKLTNFCNDSFLNIDINIILENMQGIDFNDSYYLQLCKNNNYKFVSKDNDFINVDIAIDLIKL